MCAGRSGLVGVGCGGQHIPQKTQHLCRGGCRWRARPHVPVAHRRYRRRSAPSFVGVHPPWSVSVGVRRVGGVLLASWGSAERFMTGSGAEQAASRRPEADCGPLWMLLPTMSRMAVFFGDRGKGIRPKTRVVYAPGEWDLFHAGHVRFLAAARSLGDFLIAGCYTDSARTPWRRNGGEGVLEFSPGHSGEDSHRVEHWFSQSLVGAVEHTASDSSCIFGQTPRSKHGDMHGDAVAVVQ